MAGATVQDEEWRKRAAAPDHISVIDEHRPPHVTEMTFEMPTTFIPASVPLRPLDTDLRVALILPVADTASKSSWVYWGGATKGLFRECLVVDHAVPVAAILPAVLAQLFPRLEIIDRATAASDAGEYDLVLGASVHASNIAIGETFGGVTVTGTLTASRSDRSRVTVIEGTGKGNVSKYYIWNEKFRAKRVGVVAIQAMLHHLVHNLIADPQIREILDERAAARARPSQLETTVRLDDEGSILPNGRLDAGESAKLVFTVRNHGPGQAFGARLRLSSPQRELVFQSDHEIGDIAPGTTIVTIPITAGLGVQNEAVQLHIDTTEKRGYGGRPLIAEIATERLHRPNLEIADVGLSDFGSGSEGDRNGRPANGETLEATIVIRNGGPGPAVGGELFVSADDPRISVVDPRIRLPPIPTDGVTQAYAVVRVPVTYDAGSLALTLRAVELRGDSVAQTRRSVVWGMDFRRPAVEIAYRLYDGNSVGSQGNRDGVANTGEQLELVLLATNRGSLIARNVQLALASPAKDVSVQPDRLTVGDLPPNVEAAEQRVVVRIPRTLGRDVEIRTIPLSVIATQGDFEARETRIDLAFAVHRPDLMLTLSEAAPLVEGNSSALWLDVRNQGLLAAERVQIEVTSANAAVDLLDERGAPVGKRLFDVGTVAARTTRPRVELKVHVKRKVTAATVLLKAIAVQQDYPAVTHEASLAIEREQPAHLSALPPTRPERRDRVAPVPANVAFRRYEDGEHVAHERIALRFEVQSASSVDHVRLEHNGRAMELAPGRVVPGSGGRLWEFEQQIRLEYGANAIEVVAVTSEGLRSSRRLSIHRDRPEGRIWVAVVGISDYTDRTVASLAFARQDAAAVAAYYRDRFGLDEKQIIQLLDKDATLANIKRRIGTELVANAQNPNDTVILYFAGHGQKELDRASADADGFTKYIVPHDADSDDLFSSALSMEELARILHRLRPERVALILDTCFSGAAEGGRTLFDPAVRTRGVVTDEFLDRLAGSGKGRVVLAASGANEIAFERASLGHGVFTFYLLEGLRGAADDDRDGQVDVDEIYKYVSRKVVGETRGSQRPMKKASSQTGIVVLGKTSTRTRD